MKAQQLLAPWDAWNIRLCEHWHATATSSAHLIDAAAWLAELPLYAALALTLAWVVRRKDGGGGIWIATAIGIAFLAEFVVATTAYHPRPFAAGLGPAWVHHAPNNSMPSTHVTVTWVMALVALFRRQHPMALVLFALGCLMAWARIYVGIHWPADMVGAAVSAGLSVALAWCGLWALRQVSPIR